MFFRPVFTIKPIELIESSLYIIFHTMSCIILYPCSALNFFNKYKFFCHSNYCTMISHSSINVVKMTQKVMQAEIDRCIDTLLYTTCINNEHRLERKVDCHHNLSTSTIGSLSECAGRALCTSMSSPSHINTRWRRRGLAREGDREE